MGILSCKRNMLVNFSRLKIQTKKESHSVRLSEGFSNFLRTFSGPHSSAQICVCPPGWCHFWTGLLVEINHRSQHGVKKAAAPLCLLDKRHLTAWERFWIFAYLEAESSSVLTRRNQNRPGPDRTGTTSLWFIACIAVFSLNKSRRFDWKGKSLLL